MEDIKYLYTQDELEQKSDAWLEFRRDKIGSSEISILNGNFPKFWCDDNELFLRKMGKPHEISNDHMKRGNDHEDIARRYVENYLNNYKIEGQESVLCKNVYDRTNGIDGSDIKFEQCTVIHKEIPYLFASYDGLDIKNKLVLELKCPSQNTFTKILKNRVPTIPKMYYDQVQTQLMIANSHYGITKALFGVFFKEGVYFENKITKITNLIRLILVETDLNEEYCEGTKDLCERYIDMIERRQYNTKWNSN